MGIPCVRDHNAFCRECCDGRFQPRRSRRICSGARILGEHAGRRHAVAGVYVSFQASCMRCVELVVLHLSSA